MKTKYQELHNQFRDAANIYLKGSITALAVIGFALGYLFKIPLEPVLSRTFSSVVLIIMLFWYICSFWALRVYSSLSHSIRDASQDLGYTFEIDNYRWFKAMIISAMCVGIFIVAVFIYLSASPPVVMKVIQ